MSIGNTKTNGNKGNNFPFQLAVLQLLEQIALGGGGGGGGCPCPSSAQEATLAQVLTKLTAVAVTPGLLRATGAGNVAAGAKSVSVYNAGPASGLVLGQTIKSGESFTWSAGDMNNTLGAISYDGTGTELVITTVV